LQVITSIVSDHSHSWLICRSIISVLFQDCFKLFNGIAYWCIRSFSKCLFYMWYTFLPNLNVIVLTFLRFMTFWVGSLSKPWDCN